MDTYKIFVFTSLDGWFQELHQDFHFISAQLVAQLNQVLDDHDLD
jgi:hypothetical protein